MAARSLQRVASSLSFGLAELRWGEAFVEELLDDVYPRRCRLCGEAAQDDLACDEHDPRGRGSHASDVGGTVDTGAVERSSLAGGVESQAEGPAVQPALYLDRHRCGRCAAPLPRGLPDRVTCAACRRRSPGLATTVTLGDYVGGEPLREWVLALKHGGRADLARPLASLLAPRLLEREPAPGARLVPVPAHFLRRLERGGDQAARLALALGEVTGLPVEAALVRRRATPPQGAPGAVSRAANVRGAFRVRRRAARRLAGREVWLVDDVFTTGATLAECARSLRRAGARRVAAAVVARAAPRS